MNIDATFWVAISFLIFVAILFYFKIPQKIIKSLDENIQDIKKNIEDAEKLKDEAKDILSEYETKISKSKKEIGQLLEKAKNDSEKSILKKNEEFHIVLENRKKMAEEKIKQMKIQAIKDLKVSSVNIALNTVEKIIKNSIDKKKLDKIYYTSIDETKKILKNKSI